MKKTTTNRNTQPRTESAPLLLPEYSHSRAQRIAAAVARHPNHTAAVITLTAFTPSSGEAVTNSAHAAAYLALRARHQASGLQLMDELNRQQQRDRQRENIPAIAAAALAAHREHDEHRAAADVLQAIADRVTTPAEQAAEAAQAAKDERAAAAQAQAQAAALDRIIETTSHSDRADISQAAAAALLATGDFTQACKAAGRAIAAVAAAQGCTATRTKVQPITAEEAAEIRASYPECERIPFKVREGLAAGYITIEQRNSKRFSKGWYMVKHYHTQAPYISYETFASGEGAQALTTNGGINAISSQGDAEQIADLMNRANLSERERTIVLYMLDNTAASAGIAAVEEHQQRTKERKAAAADEAAAKRIQREADKQTEGIRSKAQIANAMHRAGVYSDTNQRKTLQRIRAKLDEAKRAPIPTDKPHRSEQEQQTAAPAALDLVSIMSRRAAEIQPAAPVVRWTRRAYYKGEAVTITAEDMQREEDSRQEYQRSHAADVAYQTMRRACRDSSSTTAAVVMEYTRSNRTPATVCTTRAASSAAHAAWVFVRSMNAAEIAAWYAAEQEAAKTAAAEAEAKAAAKGKQFKTPAELAAAAERRAALLADMERWEAAQAARKAAEAAKEAQAAEQAERRRAAYNAAIRAAYAKMNTTHAAATEQQRAKAKAAAERAADKAK